MHRSEWLAAAVLALILSAMFLFTLGWHFDLNLEGLR